MADTPAPDPVEALLRDVERLDRAASRPPWTSHPEPEDGHPREIIVQYGTPSDMGGFKARWSAPAPTRCDAEAIACFRTAAPRLAAIVRVLRDALDRLDDTGGSMWSAPSTSVAVAALSRADAIARGE